MEGQNVIEFSCGGIDGRGNLMVDADSREAVYFAAVTGTPIEIDGTAYKVKSIVVRGRTLSGVDLLKIEEAPHIIFEKV